jgi:uncharacterized protein YjiS (DUF1127 family)
LAVDHVIELRRIHPSGNAAKEAVMKIPSLKQYLRARRAYRDALRELSSYSDHELHDIGIDRADIPEIAHLTARQQQQPSNAAAN